MLYEAVSPNILMLRGLNIAQLVVTPVPFEFRMEPYIIEPYQIYTSQQ